MTQLVLSEAVPLAHALVDRVAHDLGVRVLFIKGPAAHLQGLRPWRSSVDVDVLVDPAGRDLLAGRLTDLGWIDEHPYTSPTVLPMHSTTHRHPAWPCELDLHDRFPGFFADPQIAFDTLWVRRATVDLAARSVPTPDFLGHALVLAMHCLRDPGDTGKAAELAQLEDQLRGRCSAEELDALARLAHRLGAADTAEPFLSAVGAPPVGRGSTGEAELRAWRLRTEPQNPTAVSWVEELRHLPKRSWPHYLWYAAWLSERELRLADPTLPRTRSAVTRARIRRLRRGLKALPAAVRSVSAIGMAPSEVGMSERHVKDELSIESRRREAP